MNKNRIGRIEKLVRAYTRRGRKPGAAVVIYDRESEETLQTLGKPETAGTVVCMPHNGRDPLDIVPADQPDRRPLDAGALQGKEIRPESPA